MRWKIFAIGSMVFLASLVCWSSKAAIPIIVSQENPFSKDKADYGQSGYLDIYGKLRPGLELKTLPTFGEAHAFYPQHPLADLMKDERVIVAIEGAYDDCNIYGSIRCYRYVESTCKGLSGGIVHCVIRPLVVDSLLNETTNHTFTAFRLQSAKDKVNYSFEHASPEITWVEAYENEQKDNDLDKVPDYRDNCPDTPLSEPVDAEGCSASQKATVDGDEDEDGVYAPEDKCPDTPLGEPVDAEGCSASQTAPIDGDEDGDGVSDPDDRCPGTELGVDVDADGCSDAQLATIVQSDSDEGVAATGEGESAAGQFDLKGFDSAGSCSLVAR